MLDGVLSDPTPIPDDPLDRVVFFAQPINQPAGLYVATRESVRAELLIPGAVGLDEASPLSPTRPMTVLGGRVLVHAPNVANPSAGGHVVWTDGTPSGTVVVAPAPVPTIGVVAGDQLACWSLTGAGVSGFTCLTKQGLVTTQTRPTALTRYFVVEDTLVESFIQSSLLRFRVVFPLARARDIGAIDLGPMQASGTSIWPVRDGLAFYVSVSYFDLDTRVWRVESDPPPDQSDIRIIADFPRGVSIQPVLSHRGTTVFYECACPWAQSSDSVTLWLTRGDALSTRRVGTAISPRSMLKVRDRLLYVPGEQVVPTLGWLNLINGDVNLVSQPTSTSAFVRELWQTPINGLFEMRSGSIAVHHGNRKAAVLNSQTNASRPAGSLYGSFFLPNALLGSRVLSFGHAFNNSGTTNSGLEPLVLDLCPGDYDNDGAITLPDLLNYIDDWMIGSRLADMDGPGDTPSAQDFLTFLSSWLAGC